MLVLLGPAGCTDSSEKSARDSLRGAAAGCNVLLITLDTTRADRLGCYGWKQAVTPALDATARAGARFEHAYAQVSLTFPSHVVLMTGMRPPETGVRLNGAQKLGPQPPTLAGIFGQKGYRTAAFVASAILDTCYGLDRGFDVYDDQTGVSGQEERPQRPAGEVCDAAIAWLNANADAPFLAWVHFYDPHVPYTAPEEFVKKTSNPYDAEVAYMDAHVGRLLTWLDQHELRKKTLLVVVGDHGESLGEHGYAWHELLLYDSILRVPLLMSLPGTLRQGVTVGETVRLTDVLPTILKLQGWQIPEEVSGVSLVAALAGRSLPQLPVYSETDYPYDGFGWAKLRGLREGSWKYIHAPVPELYDVSVDPGELRNLAAADPERARWMEADLAQMEAEMTKLEGGQLVLSAEESRSLRSLGYVTGGSPAQETAAEPIQRKNPVEMADAHHAYRKAELYVNAKTPEHSLQAVEILEPLVQRSPESFAILVMLTRAYAGAGMLDESLGTLLTALPLHPERADLQCMLARVLLRRGAVGKAVEACEQSLKLNSGYAEAAQLLPQLQLALERQQAQITQWREALQAAPADAGTCLLLGYTLVHTGQFVEGIRVLKQGHAHNPEDANLANTLAWHLATAPDDELRDASEALRLARVACQGAGGSSASALDTLAAALAEAGQFDEAIETARRAMELAEHAGENKLREIIARRLRLYEAGKPYRAPY